MPDRLRRVAIGVTGASGALYAVRTVSSLLALDVQVELVVSDLGRRLLRDELGAEATVDKLATYISARYGVTVASDNFVIHSNKDVGATIASGSYLCDAMAIVPCSIDRKSVV